MSWLRRWRHKRALRFYSRVYHSLDWMRSRDPELCRRNIKGRHAAYRAVMKM